MFRQRGQSMTEFAIILPLLLLLILGALQFIFIYQAKTTLNYATYEAVRAGSLENAQLEPVQNGFTRAMAAYFVRPEDDSDEKKSAALVQARDIAKKKVEDRLVLFERINPTTESFDTFGEDVAFGTLEIPNSHLLYRDAKKTDGNGLSIQDANLLKIRVTYCMDLIVPFANTIIETAAYALPSSCDNCKAFVERCMGDDGTTRLPISAFSVMRMQSPPRTCTDCYAGSRY